MGLKIAMLNLTGGGFSGGYRKYLLKTLPLLLGHSRVDSVRVYMPPRECAVFVASGFSVQPLPRIGLRHHLGLAQLVLDGQPDVAFVPTAYWVPVGIPIVVMIHNMEPLTMPLAGLPPREAIKNLARAAAARRACHRADRVLAVSEYVRNFLVDKWHIDPIRVGLVYHGIEEPPRVEDLAVPACFRDGVTDKFVFTAGSIRPARALEDLLGALVGLADRGLPLVVAGSASPGTVPYWKRMQRLADDLGVSSRVRWVGQLTSAEMSWCYYHCLAFVMTSRVEACPNIVLEAMSHGAVCVSSRNPPMPEFFADSAVYYDAGDAESLREALDRVLSLSESEAAALRYRARQRASEFTWEHTAERTIEELEKACR